ALGGNLAGVGNKFWIRAVARRRSHANARSKAGGGQQQRMSYVVTVADIGEAHVLQIAEAFHEGEVVGQRLAGMFQIAERVDHRNAGVLGQDRKSTRLNSSHVSISY